MKEEKKGEGKRVVLLIVGFLHLTLQALALAIVQEQGPGLKTPLFCSSLEVLYLYNVLSKATVSLGKEGRGKKKKEVVMWRDKLGNKL